MNVKHAICSASLRLGEHWGDGIFTFALPCIMVSLEKRCIHLRMKGEKKLNKKDEKKNTERQGWGEEVGYAC